MASTKKSINKFAIEEDWFGCLVGLGLLVVVNLITLWL